MSIRVTVIFGNLDQELGWSESYHLAAPTTLRDFFGSGAANAGGTELSIFLKSRKEMLAAGTSKAKGAYLWKVRVSVEGGFRTTRVYNLSTADARGIYGPVIGPVSSVDPVEAWTRLIVDADCGDGPHGRVFLGGVPINQRFPPNTFQDDGGFATKLKAFTLQLKTLGWFIPRRKTRGLFVPPIVPITSFTVAEDMRTASVQPSAIGLLGAAPPSQGYVIIRGRHPSEWNGIHHFTYNAGPGTLTLGPNRTPMSDGAHPGSGSAQLLLPQDGSSVLDTSIVRFTSRKVGQSPFVVYRGRRRRQT